MSDKVSETFAELAREIVRGEVSMWPTIGEFNRNFDSRVEYVAALINSTVASGLAEAARKIAENIYHSYPEIGKQACAKRVLQILIDTLGAK